MNWSKQYPTVPGWYWVHCKWKMIIEGKLVNQGESTYVGQIEIDDTGAYILADTSGTLNDPEPIYYRKCTEEKGDKFWFMGPLEIPEKPA